MCAGGSENVSYTATVVWKEGIHFEGESAGQTVDMDGNPESGGQGLGMSPIRLALVALGGCTGMDVISILQKMRQDVTALSVELDGERAAEHPKVFTEIELIYRVRGRSLARDAVEKAVALSEDKYCSVGGMLRKAAHVTSRIIIEEEAS